MSTTQQKTWLITGSTRGLGKSLAEAVLAAGHTVIGTARDGSTLAGADILHADMSKPDTMAVMVQKAHAIHGRLDVIVNNAGYGHLAAVEETQLSDARHQLDVNFYSPFEIIRAALPFLRAQRSGHIINVSSIAGIAPSASSGIYAASKFALAGLSDSLRQELAPLGIRVTIVEPGAFRTDFLSSHSLRKAPKVHPDYEETVGKALGRFDGMAGTQAGDPAKAATAILNLVNNPNPPLHLLLGSDALKRARTKLADFTAEVEANAAVSVTTDYI